MNHDAGNEHAGEEPREFGASGDGDCGVGDLIALVTRWIEDGCQD